MSKHLNFKASTILLSEEFSANAEKPQVKKHQLLKTGSFSDPRYGKFEITRKMFADMIKNFDAGVRGVIPAVDYAHDTEGVAAGWFKKLYEVESDAKSSTLWAEIEYTPKGQKTLSDKEYGYLSADFDANYVDNETQKKHGCVLLGAGLTNRPVIKGMQPAIQLSEQGDNMTEQELAEKKAADDKKLADDAASAAKVAAFDKMATELGVSDPEAMMKKIAEMKAGKKEEPAPEKKEDAPELAETKKQLAEANKKLTEQKKESEFNLLLSEGKVCAAQKPAYLSGDVVEFAKNQSPMKLGEVGHGGSGGGTDKKKDFQDEIIEKSKAMAKEKSITLSEAQGIVLKEHKDLADKYKNLI